MTKKQLTEKCTQERSKAAGEASKLNVKVAGLTQRVERFRKDPTKKLLAARELERTRSQLMQIAARVVTIDAFLKDI